jgi:nucleotide-binding universal stress UspA family protein
MSLEVKKILCCIAMAPSSEYILLRALHEAEKHDALLDILHIIPSYDAKMAVPIVAYMGEEKYRQLQEEHKEEATGSIQKEIIDLKDRLVEEHLDKSADRIAAIHVYEGDPELEILNMAEQTGADMLVMGTHAKGLTQYTLMGSVSSKVIKTVRIPVLLVPPVKK